MNDTYIPILHIDGKTMYLGGSLLFAFAKSYVSRVLITSPALLFYP